MRLFAAIAAVALVPPLAHAQPATPSPLTVEELVPFGGPVAGMPGYKLTLTPSKRHCGGQRIVITRPKQRAAADAPLAAVLDLKSPTGLDFTPAPEHKARSERSMKRFTAFVEELTKTGGAAEAFYGPRITGDDEASFAASARLAQAKVHAARVLRYAEIPADVRAGDFADEKIRAYCDKLIEVSEPLFAAAQPAFDKCHAGAARFPDAWWAPVCRAP